MCGIAAIFNIKGDSERFRSTALTMSRRIRHRGPDWSGIYVGKSAVLAHERLSIVDPASGGQPLFSPDRKQVLAVNGEIYNHQDIRREFAGKYSFATGSDCEVILALYREKGAGFLEDLNGIFAFALYDEEKDDFLIARDPIGVIPLYIGRDREGKIYCASELKALEGICDSYEPFLPGHCFIGSEGVMKRWYRRDWEDYDNVKENRSDITHMDIRWMWVSIALFLPNLLLWTFLSARLDYVMDSVYYLTLTVSWSIVAYNTYYYIPLTQGELKPDVSGADGPWHFAGKLKELTAGEYFIRSAHLTLTDLAAELGTNRTTLSNYLNQELGTTFYDYVNSRRLLEAEHLLSDRSVHYSTEHLAELSGFNSLSTFRRAFFKKHGLSPQQYRTKLFT